jgi:hypothetical protein
MVDRHPVTYDSTKEDAFIVHLQHKQVKFTWENGLYDIGHRTWSNLWSNLW